MLLLRHRYFLAAFTGLCVVLAAVIERPSHSKSPSCKFAITAPATDTARVSYGAGVIVQGTACPRDSVWVFDYDTLDSYFYRDNSLPLKIIAGSWSFRDKPIGDVGDASGTRYRIVALNANRACSKKIRLFRPEGDGDVRLRRFPSPCPPTADDAQARSIVVSRR